MKKNGFTLAEVLVTLGIIGVVAALTTPALIQNVGNAKIGPKLQKAKATIETATEMMLTENNANTITSVAMTPAELGRELGKYMKLSSNTATTTYHTFASSTDTQSSIAGRTITSNTQGCPRFDTDDGLSIMIEPVVNGSTLRAQPVHTNYASIPNNQLIAYVYVDINGAENPNRAAKDLFAFALYNDGTMRPYGGNGALRSTDLINANRWNMNHNCNDTKVNNWASCTGSIFENGMKIIYQ